MLCRCSASDQLPSATQCSPVVQRVLILGAGPTALGALYRLDQLRRRGFIPAVDIRLLEQAQEVGGLARTLSDGHGFSWDLGVHVMGVSKYPDFVEALAGCVPGWRLVPRCAMADMAHVMGTEDAYVPYPVQNSVPYFPDALKRRCLDELSGLMRPGGMPPSSDDSDNDFGTFSRQLFGETLQHIFIRPYNEKVWTVRLEEMGTRWLAGRVPLIDPAKLAQRCAMSREQLAADESQRQTAFRYPAECRGVGEMWRRFAARFPAEVFQMGQRVVAIDAEGKCVETEGGRDGRREWPYDVLISTIPLTELGRLSGLAPELPLKHSMVILVGIGLNGAQSRFARQLSWAYYPRPEIVFYRCTVLSNFSPELVPQPLAAAGPSTSNYSRPPLLEPSENPYWSVLCEIGRNPEAQTEPLSEGEQQQLVRRVVEDLGRVGIVQQGGAARVCSSWVHVLPFGYPIPTLGRDTVLAQCHAVLGRHDIYSRGRFGGWRYEVSNQDHSFQCGLELVDRIFLGVPESLYVPGDAETADPASRTE